MTWFCSFAGRGKDPEESPQKDSQQAVGSGQPAQEEGVHRRAGEQVHKVTLHDSLTGALIDSLRSSLADKRVIKIIKCGPKTTDRLTSI